MLVRTSRFQGATIRPIVSRHTGTLLSLLFTIKFSSACLLKYRIKLVSTFVDERARKPNEKETNKLRLSVFFFCKPTCLQKHVFTNVLYYHPSGYFPLTGNMGRQW